MLRIIIQPQASVYSGPGENYHFRATYYEGFVVRIIGQDLEGEWLVIMLPGPELGWLKSTNVDPDLPSSQIQVYEAPPVPPPTETPQPRPAIYAVYKLIRLRGWSSSYYGFEVHLSGFQPEETVAIEIFGPDGSLARSFKVTVNLKGEAKSSSLLIDATGVFTITGTGSSGSKADTSVFVPVTSNKDDADD
ncbi:MAG TPA: hypothetical protein VMN57_00365 [Anaerolineales bacterium]|nr:hypothetical protein [Anaerolineales bacterium]